MKNQTRVIQIVLLAAAWVLSLLAWNGSFSSARAASSTVKVTLEMPQPVVAAQQAVTVRVTLTNTGGLPVRLLRWLTPVDGVRDPLFLVTRGGEAVRYIGRLTKRPAPTAADYLTLQPGESLVREVDLAESYDFSVSGEYSIRYETAPQTLFSEQPKDRSEADRLDSNEVAAWIEGRPAPRHSLPPSERVTGGASFRQCSAAKKVRLVQARTQASLYANQSHDYLQAGLLTSLYTTWFGAYTDSRYASVAQHFMKIREAMDTAHVTFDCTCSDDYYAYVYPDEPYFIYLCRVFWSAPLTGTDSEAGTLIHEMSHFYVVAGTDDYVYGQAGAKNLAKTDPAKAVMNADNHEYFAENSAPIPGAGILVHPNLNPSPAGGVCATGWYEVPQGGYNRSPLHLALNVRAISNSRNIGRWTPNIPTAGRYKVEAYIGRHGTIRWDCPTKVLSLNTARARYTVVYSGGQKTVSVDQSALDGGWADLGVFRFAAGQSGYVILTDATGEADRTRLVAFNVLRLTWAGP